MNRQKILAFTVGPVLVAALGFILLPFMAWFFSPEDIGRNNVFQIFTSFSILFFVLGLDQAYMREFHETENRFCLLRACFIPGSILLIIALALTVPFAPRISNLLYGEPTSLWYLITIVCIVLSFIARFLSLIVRMQERAGVYSASQAIPKLVIMVVLIGCVVFGVERIYINLLYANLASALAVVLILGWSTRVDWLTAATAKINKAELKKVVQFGVPLIGAGVAYWGLSATSTIALRTFSDFKELGIYSIAMGFAGVAMIFQAIFSTIWMPAVYKWVAAKKDLKKIDVVTSHVLAAVCFIFSLAGMFSWIIDFVLPPHYAPVKYIVVCCMTQPLLYTLSETTVVGLNIKRKSMHALGISVCALLCNALLSVFFVPRYGAAGAASANAIAYILFFVARTEVSVRLWRPIPRKKLYLIVTIFVLAGIWMALAGSRISITQNAFMWMTAFIFSLYLFKKNISIIFKNLKRQAI